MRYSKPNRNQKRLRFQLGLLLILLMPFAAMAVDAEKIESHLEDIGEEQLLMFFDPNEIIMTASARRPKPLNRATAAMYIITQEDIRAIGAQNLYEVYRSVPGMDIAQTDTTGYVASARGLAQVHAKRLQILLDGRPLYQPAEGMMDFRFDPMFLENIDHIEIIRGSAGVTWGVNAMNGVINIVTKHTKDTKGGLIYGAFGNREYQNGILRYGGHEEGFGWRGTVGAYNINGQGGNGGDDAYDDVRDFDTTGRTDVTLKDGSTLMLAGGHSFFSDANPNQRTNWHESSQYINTIWRKEYAKDAAVQLRWSESFYNRRRSTSFTRRVREDMIEFQNNFIKGKHNLVWGADWIRDTQATRGVQPNPYINNSYLQGSKPTRVFYDQFSAFIEDEIALKDNLWLTLGGRGYYSELTHDDWAALTALVWRVKPKHYLRFAMSRSFRRPLMRERFSYIQRENGRFTELGNENLDNESLEAYEIGYRGKFADNVELNVETFWNRHQDLITKRRLTNAELQALPGFSGASGTPLYWENALGTLETYGLETSLDWRPYDWWLIKASHTYTHQTGENRVNDEDRGSINVWTPPKHKFSLINRFYIDDKTMLHTRIYRSDPIFTANSDKVPAYWKVDFRLSRKIFDDRGEIAFGIANVQDHWHYEAENRGNNITDARDIEVPRLVYFQIFYEF